jgi:hypothetical protein
MRLNQIELNIYENNKFVHDTSWHHHCLILIFWDSRKDRTQLIIEAMVKFRYDQADQVWIEDDMGLAPLPHI